MKIYHLSPSGLGTVKIERYFDENSGKVKIVSIGSIFFLQMKIHNVLFIKPKNI